MFFLFKKKKKKKKKKPPVLIAKHADWIWGEWSNLSTSQKSREIKFGYIIHAMLVSHGFKKSR